MHQATIEIMLVFLTVKNFVLKKYTIFVNRNILLLLPK